MNTAYLLGLSSFILNIQTFVIRTLPCTANTIVIVIVAAAAVIVVITTVIVAVTAMQCISCGLAHHYIHT